MARKKIDEKKIVRLYARRVSKEVHVDNAYVFGSFARKKQLRESDLDVLIISRDFVQMPFLKRLELLNSLRTQDALHIPMDIVGVTPREFASFKDHQSPNLRRLYRESKKIV